MKTRNLIAATVAALAVLAAAPAMAFTECSTPTTVVQVFSGDTGGTNVWLANGLQFYLQANDVNFKNIFADSRLAYITGKSVTVRFSANGVSCTTVQQRSDAIGFYIVN